MADMVSLEGRQVICRNPRKNVSVKCSLFTHPYDVLG